MYAKVFQSLWDGSLADQWEGWVVLVFMLAHSDSEGFVDMTPTAISRRSGLPPDVVTRGLAILEAPDLNSRSAAEEGRRIVRIDETRSWGWRIVNHGTYRSMVDAQTRRAQWREAQTRRRERARAAVRTSPNVTIDHHEVIADHQRSSHADSDSEGRFNTVSPEPETDPAPRSPNPERTANTTPYIPTVEVREREYAARLGLPFAPDRSQTGQDSEPGASGAQDAGPSPIGAPEASSEVRAFPFRFPVVGVSHPSAGALGVTVQHGGTWAWSPTEAQVEAWSGQFPGGKPWLLQQFNSMLAWLEANPERRKTARGLPRFIAGWLTREQNHRGAGLTHEAVREGTDRAAARARASADEALGRADRAARDAVPRPADCRLPWERGGHDVTPQHAAPIEVKVSPALAAATDSMREVDDARARRYLQSLAEEVDRAVIRDVSRET
jgi:hypothetical protein